MKKINFNTLKAHRHLGDNATTTINVRKLLTDVIYSGPFGMAGHALAHKLYETDGDVELSEEECQLVRTAAQSFNEPYAIDAILNAVRKEE